MLRSKQLGQVVRRCMSAQAQLTKEEPSVVAKLSNGLRVVTCNSSAAGTQIALLVKTGSRDDSPSELGLSHCLQASAGLTSSKNTSFLTSQLLASLGADLNVTLGRESIVYNLGCFETAASELILDVLTPAVLDPKFHWWEVRDSVVQRMKYQKAYSENDPLYVLLENAHKASFRSSFGNTILSPDHMIGNHTTDMLTSRFNSAFSLSNMVLAGSGISQPALEEIGTQIEESAAMNLPGETMKRQAAKFVSSEMHVNRPGELSYAALTFCGVSANDQDAVALSVLKEMLGTQCNVKGGSGLSNGTLNKAVAKNTNNPFSTSAFSMNYSDCGLFGVSMTAPKKHLSEVVHLVASELQQVTSDCRDVKPQSVEEAKRRLRLQILTNAEGGDAVSDIAYQTSVLNKPVPTRELLCLVQEVGIDQVKAAAARVLTGKMSLTTLGEMQDGPYLKDL